MVCGQGNGLGSIALTAHTRHDAEQLRAVGGVDIILEPFSAAAHATSDYAARAAHRRRRRTG
jgi:hypothetical protein